jgi:monovalent cation:proton antiporter-2 (CPA2) family protein
LGYLIAGILIGPSGLSMIKDPHNVLHFAELGVVLLLFVIGLEIQPTKLWSMRKMLLGLGGFQIFGSSFLFTLIGHYFGLSWASALVVGFALSLSSTAFALQTLMERNQLATSFGKSSFSILLMQDLVAIPALAIIPVLGVKAAQTQTHVDGWAFLGIVLFLVFASRFVIRPVFRLITASRSREIFTAATLLIVLGVAALMQKVGLSAALGTFMAGVLLADSEYRHELETDLEPFKSLLMGLFFVAVGMGVDFRTSSTFLGILSNSVMSLMNSALLRLPLCLPNLRAISDKIVN